MVKRSQYIRIKNPLHKHFVGMPMVGGGPFAKCNQVPGLRATYTKTTLYDLLELAQKRLVLHCISRSFLLLFTSL